MAIGKILGILVIVSMAQASIAEKPLLRHSLRDLIHYDKLTMIRLVNKEINMKEENDERFLNNVADVLGQTVMLQPEFGAREASLRQLRGKLDNEEYIEVVERATNRLIGVAALVSSGADQASLFVALTNLIVEIKSLKREELKTSLEKIANAKLELNKEGKRYSMETLKRITSPSEDAKVVLSSL